MLVLDCLTRTADTGRREWTGMLARPLEGRKWCKDCRPQCARVYACSNRRYYRPVATAPATFPNLSESTLPRRLLLVGGFLCADLALPLSELEGQGITTVAIRGTVWITDGSDPDDALVVVRSSASGSVVEATVRGGKFAVEGLEPTAGTVLLTANRYSGSPTIWAAQEDAPGVVTDGQDAVWSPDGSKILFSRQRSATQRTDNQ